MSFNFMNKFYQISLQHLKLLRICRSDDVKMLNSSFFRIWQVNEALWMHTPWLPLLKTNPARKWCRFLLPPWKSVAYYPPQLQFELPESFSGLLLCPYCDALLKNIYLLFIWLHWVWVTAHGIFCWASVRLLSVVADRLSGPSVYGILLPWTGIRLVSPALEGTFLTTGPPGKSLWWLSISFWEAIRSGVERCLWLTQEREHTHSKGGSGVSSSPKPVLWLLPSTIWG